ncbi:MAG TPA: DegT/DnrJ/EryC1/StrS family aminotransferase [Planctomycetota bacterium]|nr:DegT/DnrJ/EryC1/StrS family aminotransferase [Planctomycetota bacterium]
MNQPRTIPFGRPWITDDDRKAVMEVLDGPILTHGPQCKAFEAEFAAFMGKDAHAVTMSSCMGALHMAYFALGIGPGDEVLVPAQTHTATAHAVELVGARPIFVDCDPATGNVTADRLAAAVTPKTKALSVVHFLAIPCAMPDIMRVAAKHRLKVIEDCALAIGSRYEDRHVGLFGDAGCFSFYPVKHITTAEGGMLVTKDKAFAESVARKRGFGVDRTHSERSIPGMYEVPQLGLNYRMSELQAALGRSQMRRIEENLSRRRRNFESLKKALEGQGAARVLDSADPRQKSSHYCLSVVLEGKLAGRRNELVGKLNAAGVGTSVYYPAPVPRMRYYADKYGYDASRYPEAARISDCSVALPVGQHLSPEDVDYIGKVFVETVKEMRV